MDGTKVGGYEIIRPLGSGGMGQVLLARDPKLERKVALKVLHRDFAADPTARKRFHREAKSIASLRHPGIVTIYEIGEEQGRDFIVMEFLAGMNLRSQLREHTPSQEEILSTIRKVAEAVAGAHGAGVLHRDIKPENIMVDANSDIKVVDFGLARSFDEIDTDRLPSSATIIDVMACTLELEDTLDPDLDPVRATIPDGLQLSAITETILGTPGYMAPELFTGKSATTASDIYSLGVLLYEMIAGDLPFVASSVDELLRMRVYDDTEATRLDTLPGVAVDVADLAADMLKKDPDKRPSIASVLSQIQAAQDAATKKLKVMQGGSSSYAGLSQEIDVFTPRRKRRALQAVSVLALGAAVTAGAFALRATQSSAGPEAGGHQAAHALETNSIRIAVPPIALELRSYANSNNAVSKAAATMLSTVLNRADAIYAISPLELNVSAGTNAEDRDEWMRAAKDSGAMYIATGTLSEEGGILSGTFEITNALDRTTQQFTAKPRPVAELDALLLDLANLVAAKLAPGSSIIAPQKAARRSVDSLALYETALDALNESRWVDACIQLERIVKEQPQFFEGWYHLAIASAWAAQPTENALRAARKALSLAHTERDREFMQVLIHYIGRDQAKASRLAEALAKKYPKDPELAYIHAETVYHNGHHAEALKLFNFALELAPRSRLASVHPIEHAQANGNLSRWQHFKSLRVNKDDPGVINVKPTPKLRFARRDYEALAEQGKAPWAVQAHSVLGRTDKAVALIPEGQEDKGSYLLYAFALAVESEDAKAQEAHFQTLWSRHTADSKVAGNQFRLAPVVELLVASNRSKALKTFMGYWDLPGARQIGAQESRMRAYAAPALGDASMVRTSGFLSWREEEEARALRAELAGNHKEATKIWEALLADPSEYSDTMPRFAFARNLAALGDAKRLKAACTDLLYPKMWSPALPVYRLRCSEWKALPSGPPSFDLSE